MSNDERASECGLTECAGQPMCRRCAWQAHAAIAQQPDTDWQDVMHTLIGHAVVLRGDGKTDMAAWFFTLAEKIARAHIDEAHAGRVREVAAKITREGAAIAQPAEPAPVKDSLTPERADAQPVAPAVLYSPIATRPQIDGKHPNDNEARDPARSEYLRLRGDGEGQGLCDYWKWGHAAGWNDHKRHAAAPPARQPLTPARVKELVRRVTSHPAGDSLMGAQILDFVGLVQRHYGIGEGE